MEILLGFFWRIIDFTLSLIISVIKESAKLTIRLFAFIYGHIWHIAKTGLKYLPCTITIFSILSVLYVLYFFLSSININIEQLSSFQSWSLSLFSYENPILNQINNLLISIREYTNNLTFDGQWFHFLAGIALSVFYILGYALFSPILVFVGYVLSLPKLLAVLILADVLIYIIRMFLNGKLNQDINTNLLEDADEKQE